MKKTMINDPEFLKLLMDPRKLKILNYLSNEPMTVAQVAKRLGEKSSRLYYHFNKLEEVGLIKLVETKTIGNMIEKYYATVERLSYALNFQPEMLATHYSEVLAGVLQTIQPGLELLEEDLKQGQKSDYNVDVYIYYSKLTEQEWRESHDKMISVLREKSNETEAKGNEIDLDHIAENQTADRERYVHVIMSYRLNDIERIEEKKRSQNTE